MTVPIEFLDTYIHVHTYFRVKNHHGVCSLQKNVNQALKAQGAAGFGDMHPPP